MIAQNCSSFIRWTPSTSWTMISNCAPWYRCYISLTQPGVMSFTSMMTLVTMLVLFTENYNKMDCLARPALISTLFC